MNTVLDTNVLITLWDEDSGDWAQHMLEAVQHSGSIIMPAPVYAELMALPGRTPLFIDSFCQQTDIRIEWILPETVWRIAGAAFQAHVARRRRGGAVSPRRILADFLIGAYALHNRCQLLTFDAGIYKTAFPALKIISS